MSGETSTKHEQAERLVVSKYEVTKRVEDVYPEPVRGVPVSNALLAALPHADYQRLLTGIERVALISGQMLYAPGAPIRHVYFPIDCIVSLLTTVESRRALEVGLVGHEGMAGIPLALGIGVSPVRALVQCAGTAMRMETEAFRAEVLRSMPLQCVLHRYAHALMAQIAQISACNHFHPVKARLARSLLMTRERVATNEIFLTHEFLAETLGVRRVGVTTAAGALKRQKLISYNRGNIRILDRRGLEAAACACYRNIKGMRF